MRLLKFLSQPNFESVLPDIRDNIDMYGIMGQWEDLPSEYTRDRKLATALARVYPECVDFFSVWFNEPLVLDGQLETSDPPIERENVFNDEMKKNLDQAVQRFRKKEADDIAYAKECEDTRFEEWFNIIISQCFSEPRNIKPKPAVPSDPNTGSTEYTATIYVTLPKLINLKRVNMREVVRRFNKKYEGKIEIFINMYEEYGKIVGMIDFNVNVYDEPELKKSWENAYLRYLRKIERSIERKIFMEKVKKEKWRAELNSKIKNKQYPSIEKKLDEIISILRWTVWEESDRNDKRMMLRTSIKCNESSAYRRDIRERLTSILGKEFNTVLTSDDGLGYIDITIYSDPLAE